MSIGKAACLMLLLIVGPVRCGGAPLSPGGVLIGVNTPPPLGDTVIQNVQLFAVPGAFDGRLLSSVTADDSTNPLGGLTFVYWILTEAGAGPNSIGRLTVDGFRGVDVEASYHWRGGVAPAFITRDPAGDVVGFDFFPHPDVDVSGFLAPGTNSTLLILRTSATGHRANLASLIDGGGVSVPSFGPVVPEPRSVVLALISIIAVSGNRLRRGAPASGAGLD